MLERSTRQVCDGLRGECFACAWWSGEERDQAFAFAGYHVGELIPDLRVVLDERQEQVFVVLSVDKMAERFIIPPHRVDLVDHEE